MNENDNEQKLESLIPVRYSVRQLVIIGVVFLMSVIICSIATTYLVLRNLPSAITQEILYRQNALLEKANACISNSVDNQTKCLATQAQYAEKQLNDIITNLPKRYEHTVENAINANSQNIKSRYDELQKQLTLVQQQIDGFSNERQLKAQVFFKAARKAIAEAAGEDRIRLLYLIAIENNPNKTDGLKEYFIWQKTLFQNDLKENKFNDAEARIAALKETLGSVLPTGVLEDVLAENTFLADLKTMEKVLKEIRTPIEDKQKSLLDSIDSSVKGLQTLAEGDDLKKELNELGKSILPKFSERIEAFIAIVNARMEAIQACTTNPGNELILPSMEYKEYWTRWLENFNNRLKDDSVSVQKRLEDLMSTSEFLVTARKNADEKTMSVINKIESEAKLLSVKYWQERARKLVENKTSSQNLKNVEAAELINEADKFSNEEKNRINNDLVSVNRLILDSAVKELEDNLDNLKLVKDNFSSAEDLQLAMSIQGQCLQMALRCAEMNKKFDKVFELQAKKIADMNKCTKSLVHEFQNYLVVNDMQRQELQRDSYLKWARETIDQANSIYKSCEDTKWTTWSNADIQEKLRNAWNTLKRIHPDDLNMVNPVEFKQYQEIKEKIEVQYKPSNSEKRDFKFIRFSEFSK